ncbi:hypothetical protein FA15DRAFT_698468 [Coprinopsis marcescibilis]|uniref:Tubulin-specific chaperone A n=1 Tax=Coprinopsis marcescibilis TaxID=230819 RepID=A0A5C3KBT7_COPMA|nr:hypothetical protein FA15DRAFT_698468 [Coprinopsis marcescibilis]
MSDLKAIKRQLKIKSGTVQRLHKEHILYDKEVVQLRVKREKLVADTEKADDWEWDLKNAGKLIEESEKMVKDTETRLASAVEDLRGVLAGAKKQEELAEDEDLLKAQEILETASA